MSDVKPREGKGLFASSQLTVAGFARRLMEPTARVMIRERVNVRNGAQLAHELQIGVYYSIRKVDPKRGFWVERGGRLNPVRIAFDMSSWWEFSEEGDKIVGTKHRPDSAFRTTFVVIDETLDLSAPDPDVEITSRLGVPSTHTPPITN